MIETTVIAKCMDGCIGGRPLWGVFAKVAVVCFLEEESGGACPERWHLPSKEEFETLIEAVGGIENASVLKSSSGWNENGNGSDTFMFSALPVGECNINSVECHNKGNYATFWSSTTEDYSAAKAYCFTLYAKYPAELDAATIGNSYGYRVRCVYDFER